LDGGPENRSSDAFRPGKILRTVGLEGVVKGGSGDDGDGGGGEGGGDVLAAAFVESALAVLRRDGRLCLLPLPLRPAAAGAGELRTLHREADTPLVAGGLALLSCGGLASLAVCASGASGASCVTVTACDGVASAMSARRSAK
jgi:hypothetical protein